jgi:hypothetical protein
VLDAEVELSLMLLTLVDTDVLVVVIDVIESVDSLVVEDVRLMDVSVVLVEVNENDVFEVEVLEVVVDDDTDVLLVTVTELVKLIEVLVLVAHVHGHRMAVDGMWQSAPRAHHAGSQVSVFVVRLVVVKVVVAQKQGHISALFPTLQSR